MEDITSQLEDVLTTHLDDVCSESGKSTDSNEPSTFKELTVFNFTTVPSLDDWTEQSDTVRDVGMSKGVMTLQKTKMFQRAVFFGLVNPQPNGAGFAGARTFGQYNLSGYNKFQLWCRGQGEYTGFKIILRHRGLNEEPNYSFEHYFQAPTLQFGLVELPFSQFKPYFRGKRVLNETNLLDISAITSFGVQMYGGVYLPVKQKGPATLEIDWLKAVAD